MADVTIVFRKRDGTNTGRIYVNDYGAAAELASKYRDASEIVDVISIRDEVILRWQGGHPDWKNGEVKPIKLTAEVYRFKRPDDAFWVPENRLWLLTMALQYAFEVVTNQDTAYGFEELLMQTEHHGGDDVWPLVADARRKDEQLADEQDNAAWKVEIANWMSDPEHLFVHYHVEHAALTIYTNEYVLAMSVPRLGVELADLAVQR
ncbi:MAG: hypothetical protein AAFU41_17730 [Pseudomonadota bacterium]